LFEQGFHLQQKKIIDLASATYGAIQIDAVNTLVADMQPKLKPYQQLKTALIKYRRLARHFKQPLHFNQGVNSIYLYCAIGSAGKVDDFLLLQMKALLNNIYTDELVIKVQNLQAQHGQGDDGIIGKQTLATLNTPFSQRVEAWSIGVFTASR
jgi:murein L,D-transpeptidase YcbB/YkuD